ncbi:MAG: hypothetical protein RSC24_06595 [Clostridium sp.]
MALITKKYFDEMLNELESSEGIIIDKKLAISCISEYYPNTYIPTNVRTCKADIVGIFKNGDNFKIVRLPLHRFKIDYSNDNRNIKENTTITNEGKTLEESIDNKAVLHSKGW